MCPRSRIHSISIFHWLTLDGSSFRDRNSGSLSVLIREPWLMMISYRRVLKEWAKGGKDSHNNALYSIHIHVFFSFFLCCCCFSFTFIGLVGAQVTIEPQNVVVRPDQVTRLMCKSRAPIKSCFWEINGDLYNLQEGSPYEPLGVLEDGECGIQVERIFFGLLD